MQVSRTARSNPTPRQQTREGEALRQSGRQQRRQTKQIQKQANNARPVTQARQADSASSDAGSQFFWVTPYDAEAEEACFVPDVTFASNATDYATLALVATPMPGTSGDSFTIGSFATTSQSLTGGEPVTIDLDKARVPKSFTVSLRVTKSGAGVTLPRLTLCTSWTRLIS